MSAIASFGDNSYEHQINIGSMFGRCLCANFEPALADWVKKTLGHCHKITSAQGVKVHPFYTMFIVVYKNYLVCSNANASKLKPLAAKQTVQRTKSFCIRIHAVIFR